MSSRRTFTPCTCKVGAGHVAGCPNRDVNPMDFDDRLRDADGFIICECCWQRVCTWTSCEKTRQDLTHVMVNNPRDPAAEQKRIAHFIATGAPAWRGVNKDPN